MKLEQLQQDAIILEEVGILSHKKGGFSAPTVFAQENLFVVIWGDVYTCAAPYEVIRENMHMFILFRIKTGTLYFDYDGKSFTASDGDVVLLDGKKFHHYYARKEVTFQHFIFTGNSSQAYYDYLYAKYGPLYHDNTESAFLFQYIQDELESGTPNDHKLSFLVHNILSILAIRSMPTTSPMVNTAKKYILDNYQSSIKVDDIANQVSLSKYHFSRSFKAETGYSPNEYLISVRLKHARELLSTTYASVESIAAACGFSSTSHFIRTFKKDIGITPTIFRKFFDPTGFREIN